MSQGKAERGQYNQMLERQERQQKTRIRSIFINFHKTKIYNHHHNKNFTRKHIDSKIPKKKFLLIS